MTPTNPIPAKHDPKSRPRETGQTRDAPIPGTRRATYGVPRGASPRRSRREVRRIAQPQDDSFRIGPATVLDNGLPFLLGLIDPSAHATGQELPLAPLASKRRSANRYAISSIDVWGRIADRSCLRTLGWYAGLAIATFVIGDAVAVAPRPNAALTIGQQGHVRLPAETRRACRIDTDDRLFLLAVHHQELLLVLTMATLDVMVNRHFAGLSTRSRP
jgi:hypothetical protein